MTWPAQWASPPEPLLLAVDEVHVWAADLELGAALVAQLYGRLSADERARADRYIFAADRAQFVAGRALLRRLLGRYLGLPGDELGFDYAEHGKPALAGRAAAQGLCFNLAHSAGRALYAVAWRRSVGVDLELVRDNLDYSAIVPTVFTAREREALLALPEGQRRRAFYQGWVRKEAYSKARGAGLGFGLQRFEVSLGPAPAAAGVGLIDDTHGRWALYALDPGAAYTAALALESQVAQIRCFRLDVKPLGE